MNKSAKDNSREEIIALRCGTARAGLSKAYWSNEDRERLQRMFYDGDSITDMALTFQRSEPAIFAQLQEMGMFKRSRAARQKDSECLCSKCSLYPDCDKCREQVKAASNGEN